MVKMGRGPAGPRKAICKEIGKRVQAELPHEQTGYSELMSWISGTARPHAIEIFTTN